MSLYSLDERVALLLSLLEPRNIQIKQRHVASTPLLPLLLPVGGKGGSTRVDQNSL